MFRVFRQPAAMLAGSSNIDKSETLVFREDIKATQGCYIDITEQWKGQSLSHKQSDFRLCVAPPL